MDRNPWLQIPVADYEAHMSAVGQSAVLRDFFRRIYAELKPRRLAVLGCTSGSDLLDVDRAVTESVVGVDINPDYLASARERLGALGEIVRLIQADVLHVDLPPAQFDLVHAALLLEYVDPASLFQRIYGWLSPHGVCSVVTQDPTPGIPSVSNTTYASLQLLAGRMSLRSADEVARLALESGLESVNHETVTLPGGKCLVNSIFKKSRGGE
jgi:ubiquinone/menaquinone biosynthesis C-methylase UbiE